MSLIDVEIGAIQRRRRRNKRTNRIDNTREGYIRSLLQELIPGHVFESTKPDWNKNPETGRLLELDCYAPNLKTARYPNGFAVEVQGIHHHKYCSFRHKSLADFEKYQRRDQYTRMNCENNGVYLLETPSREHTPDRDMAGWLAVKISHHVKQHIRWLLCRDGGKTETYATRHT